MPGEGLRFSLTGILHDSPSFNRTYVAVCELVADDSKPCHYFLRVQQQASYTASSFNIEVPQVAARWLRHLQLTGRLTSIFPASNDDKDHPNRWSLIATLGEEETLTLQGQEGNVKRLEAIMKAILEKTALPIPEVDNGKMQKFSRSRLIQPAIKAAVPKATPKGQSRAMAAVSNARHGKDPHLSPTKPSQGRSIPAAPISPVKSESGKRVHEDLPDDPIQEAEDEKRVKPFVQTRLFVNSDRAFNPYSLKENTSTTADRWHKIQAMPNPQSEEARAIVSSSSNSRPSFVQTLHSFRPLFSSSNPSPASTYNSYSRPKTEREDGYSGVLRTLLQSVTSLHVFASELLRKIPEGEKPDFYTSVVEILRLKKQSVNKVINPEPVKKAIGLHVKDFDGYLQQDAHEFLVTCLAQLEEDNLPPKSKPAVATASGSCEPSAAANSKMITDDDKKNSEEDLKTANEMEWEEMLDKDQSLTKVEKPEKPVKGTSPSRPSSSKLSANAPQSSHSTSASIPPSAAAAADVLPPAVAINLNDPVSKNFDSIMEHTFTCKQCGHATKKLELYRDFSLELPLPPAPALAEKEKDTKADETIKKVDDKKDDDLDDVFLFTDDKAKQSSAPLIPPKLVSELLTNFFHDDTVERDCTKCECKETLMSHRFNSLPRVLVLHLKRFKVEFVDKVLTSRKLTTRVIWEKGLDVSELCVDNARSPEPLREPEREVAHQEALDASTDAPGAALNSSQDGGLLDADADIDDELKQVLEMSKKEHAEKMKQERAKAREEEELKLAMQASVREHRQRSRKYVLQSVVTHSGQSATHGHYVSDVRDPISGMWRRFNDSLSKEVPANEIFKNESREREGYMFFFVHEAILSPDKEIKV